ncbi:MAG: single-stranded-DNA-specific exonuclease RecJ [Bryobacteraceae bacterium]
MPGTRWLIPSPDSFDSQAAAGLARELGVGILAARVLAHRGLSDPAAARRFLSPSLADLYSPALLRDMEPAVDRLLAATRNREKILIYGDYDVDGTLSVVLLLKAIELAGGSAAYHVPHRLKDGYGMRTEVVERAAAEGVRLIVSVDTGIRAAAVVERATELGIDVVVTDHHLPESALPKALAVLNPNRPDCAYPEKDLCGAGVAFKLAQELLGRLDWAPAKVQRICASLLKLVAIATVADVVPLTGENRAMVKHGLEGLGDPRNPGLRALFQVAGLAPGVAPTARQVAFQIAPRVNAAGRMDTARQVIELFLTADAALAAALARDLHEHNAERQRTEAATLAACLGAPEDQSACGLVYYGGDWHRGVLGIVASRLVERRHRPVFVLGLDQASGMAQGSGRSVNGFHLLEALESMAEVFVRFGGHRYAAGVTLEAARVDEFRSRFADYAATKLTPEDFSPSHAVDAPAELRELTEDAVDGVLRLGPFGHGNREPLFLATGVEVASAPVLMKERHLRVAVRQAGRSVTLKGWNLGARAAELPLGARVDILFSLEEDAYSASRGYPGWCAVLRDWREA